MKRIFYPFIQNFIRCGITGWCLEIIFTAFHAFRRREMALKGTTSLWMFPIYGCFALLKPLFEQLHKVSLPFRGSLYAVLIFLGEYISGTLLTRRNLCPWNYRRHKWHVNGIIRLDFFPYWFLTGLVYEKILTDSNPYRISLFDK